MPKKVIEYDDFSLWLGSFEGEEFVWKKLKTFTSFEDAYKAYKKFTNEQMQYDSKELLEIWDSARLDIELKQGEKLLNWVGIYSRKTTYLDEDEDEDEDEKTTKDSIYFGPRI